MIWGIPGKEKRRGEERVWDVRCEIYDKQHQSASKQTVHREHCTDTVVRT